MQLIIDHLHSGGLITNYYCSAKCAHCAYASSPTWPKQYIEREQVEENLRIAKRLGCNAMHIGGGEPCLDLSGLSTVLQVAQEVGVVIEYVETNSSWYRNESDAMMKLQTLKDLGVNALLLSVSPYHVEFVPLRKVQGLRRVAQRLGMGVFLWKGEFMKELELFDPNTTHSLVEQEVRHGSNYVSDIIGRYGVGLKGRALNYYAPRLRKRPLTDLIEETRGCRYLANSSHFHLDLFGNYLPGSCAGVSIGVSDLGKPLVEDEYPILTRLFREGVTGLLRLALNEGFHPRHEYLSRCHLCWDMRRFFVVSRSLAGKELQPAEIYRQA